MEEIIRGFVNYAKDNWDKHIVNIKVSYNSAVNSTTLCTLFFINYGIHPKVFPIETIGSNNPSISQFLKSSSKATKFAYDRVIKKNEKMDILPTGPGFFIVSK